MANAKQKRKQATKQTDSRGLRPLDYVVIVVTIGLAGFGFWRAFGTPDASSKQDCAQFGREYQVTVKADAFMPEAITVNRCDRVVVSNQGSETYDFMLGTRDKHVPYPGFSGQLLRPGEYFTFDALRAGSYPLHDHTRDRARLQITINE